jgi:hypothetical protein
MTDFPMFFTFFYRLNVPAHRTRAVCGVRVEPVVSEILFL